MREKIKSTDWAKIGFYDKNLIKVAGKTAKKFLQKRQYSKEQILDIFKEILKKTENYQDNTEFQFLLEALENYGESNQKLQQSHQIQELREEPLTYPTYGLEQIDQVAHSQMQTAMRLPISVAGALMPDAHSGYGLPIGGVLATEPNKVIPYAVGVDIACRMCMSVFEMEANFLEKHKNKLEKLLLKNTCFGTGKGFSKPMLDDVFEKPAWQATRTIRQLKDKAFKQIGSSGTGNHFVEWGIIEILKEDNETRLPVGKYLALLSHSGSRGFGANIAGYYTKIAMEQSLLPKDAKHLAWLDLRTEAGQEYWIGMNLAGDYASANHHQIHKKMAFDLEVKPLKIIENHHNFAWKDKLITGEEVIIHRKGATPAHKGELGIIPGSMTKPGFLIKGKGNTEALFSASHGAGRQLSRSKARKNITKEDMKRALTENQVKLIGGDLDEAPDAYKDIFKVMEFQTDLVEVIGQFQPKIVRMAESAPPRRQKKKGEISFNET